jgi:hypothetical protein
MYSSRSSCSAIIVVIEEIQPAALVLIGEARVQPDRGELLACSAAPAPQPSPAGRRRLRQRGRILVDPLKARRDVEPPATIIRIGARDRVNEEPHAADPVRNTSPSR